MSETAEGLPRFKKPPVVETILGVHFRPVEKLTSAHQGLLWEQCFHTRFPNLEERPPLEETQERFGEERLASTPTLRWRVKNRPDVPRLWAASESGVDVVQIQRSAFYANWLKTSEEAEYRPYGMRREEFERQLTEVDQFLRDQDLGKIDPTSCTATYINHIEYGGFSEIGPALAKLLTCWTNETSDNWLPAPDNAIMNLSFPMPEDAGRLNLALTPIVRHADRKQMLRLELTARGSATGRDIAGAMAWIDLGHEWIVRGFASVTRPEMHDLWERIQ